MKSTICKLSGVVALTVALGVQASPLPPSSGGPLAGSSDSFGSSPLASLSVPFVSSTFSGILVSKVWNDDPNNVGALTFTYELSNNVGSPDPLDRFTLSSYAGFTVDASYLTPSGVSVVPTSVTRNPAGNQISFNFTGLFEGTLAPGSSSPILVLRTDSTSYQNSFAAVIDSSSVNVATFAPLAVPEPATAALLVVGALIAGFRRKK